LVCQTFRTPTDNHLVLVEEDTLQITGATAKKTLALREEESITASSPLE
jgi:hypothetical protein